MQRYLIKKFGTSAGLRVLHLGKERAYSVHRVCRFLRKEHVYNVHRFLAPMEINGELESALEKWGTKMSRNTAKRDLHD